MKRSNKFLLGGVFVLLIGGGAYLNYLKAQPQEQLSDLTLANLEAMADIYTDKDIDRDDCQGAENANCGMPVVTPNGTYMEYLTGATKRPGWA